MKASELLGGRYELRGVLGRGGMAEVRDGWDTRLARPVAIKILHPAIDTQPDNRRRFEAEARAAAALNCSHIVAVHDTGEHDGMPYIVMERLSDESLHDKIARGPLPQPMVRAVLDDVLVALEAAHAAGILHRDIKPANILFSASGEAKVSDFGIAKTAQSNFTAAGQVFGTMAYLSPDRVMGRPATPADDVYALGVVGYEALTGRRAFPQENIAALAQAILHEQLPPIAALRPDVDPALAAVVECAMARDSAKRYPTATAMRAALAGRPPVAAAPPGTLVLDAPLPPPTPFVPLAAEQPRGRWGAVLVIGAVFAALLLALILIVLDSPQPSAPRPITTSTPVAPSTTMPTPAASTEETAQPQVPEYKPDKPDKPGKPGKPDKPGNGDDG